eukprot:TRINITY_DN2496_c0_g1_i2.p1 TRINITY_DN2496_c0_g1~~TRINITY_DN2496_c0_g1_i2.p1  ORF type:complete len:920 (-),score=185.84 TRINITY_DN2496_c0_g1_i2:183-2942(-)
MACSVPPSPAKATDKATFHSLFNLPADEIVFEDYSAALQEKRILIHGRLYIAQNYLCFHSIMFGTTTRVIPMRDITGLAKRNFALVFPNAIEVSVGSEKLFFTSLMTRDVAFQSIYNLWSAAKKGAVPSEASGSSDSEVPDDVEVSPLSPLHDFQAPEEEEGEEEEEYEDDEYGEGWSDADDLVIDEYITDEVAAENGSQQPQNGDVRSPGTRRPSVPSSPAAAVSPADELLLTKRSASTNNLEGLTGDEKVRGTPHGGKEPTSSEFETGIDKMKTWWNMGTSFAKGVTPALINAATGGIQTGKDLKEAFARAGEEAAAIGRLHTNDGLGVSAAAEEASSAEPIELLTASSNGVGAPGPAANGAVAVADPVDRQPAAAAAVAALRSATPPPASRGSTTQPASPATKKADLRVALDLTSSGPRTPSPRTPAAAANAANGIEANEPPSVPEPQPADAPKEPELPPGVVLPPVHPTCTHFVYEGKDEPLHRDTLAVTPTEFYVQILQNEFMHRQTVAASYTDSKLEPWVLDKAGCCQTRTWNFVTPIVNVSGFGMFTPKSTRVIQVHRVAFRDKNKLVWETSSRSLDVPYADAFVVCMKYEVCSLGDKSAGSSLAVFCNVKFIKSVFVKGVIESNTVNTARDTTAKWAALAKEFIAETAKKAAKPAAPLKKQPTAAAIANGTAKPRPRRPVRKSTDATAAAKPTTAPLPKAPSSTPPVAPELVSPYAVPKPASSVDTQASYLDVALSGGAYFFNFVNRKWTWLFVTLMLSIFTVSSLSSLGHRVEVFEQRWLESRREFALVNEKVAFLEALVSELSRNVTGTPGGLQDQLANWRSTGNLNRLFSDYSAQLARLEESIHASRLVVTQTFQSALNASNSSEPLLSASAVILETESGWGWVSFLGTIVLAAALAFVLAKLFLRGK